MMLQGRGPVDFEDTTYCVHLRRYAVKDGMYPVTTSTSSRVVQRLSDIAKEMCNPFQSIRASQIGTSGQQSSLRVFHAAFEDLGLIRDGRNNAATFRAIMVIVQAAT